MQELRKLLSFRRWLHLYLCQGLQRIKLWRYVMLCYVMLCYVMLCYVMLWCVMNFVPSYSQWDFNCSISTWSPFQELKSIYSFRKRRGRQFNFSENKNKQCTNPRQDNSSSFKSPSVFKSPVGAFPTPAEMAEFAKNLGMRLSASVFLDTKETTVKVTAVME